MLSPHVFLKNLPLEARLLTITSWKAAATHYHAMKLIKGSKSFLNPNATSNIILMKGPYQLDPSAIWTYPPIE